MSILMKMMLFLIVIIAETDAVTCESSAYIAPMVFLVLATSVLVAFGVAGAISPMSISDIRRRVLILTDVGEEIDDETAILMILKCLHKKPDCEIHVVFCTGDIDLRIKRWCTMINSLPEVLCNGRVKYFRGTQTTRPVRHTSVVTKHELEKCGLSNVSDFLGGEYSDILHISPVHGIESYMNIRLMPGLEFGSWISVGTEGSTNFPTDEHHEKFKKHLLSQNFMWSCVEATNYAPWTLSCINILPTIFQDGVYCDEWLKATGRIAPVAVNLFVRFRVNVMVNYTVIFKGYELFEKNVEKLAVNLITAVDPATAKENAIKVCSGNRSAAKKWTEENANKWLEQINFGYVEKSRNKDGIEKADARMRDLIPGQNISWMSLVTPQAKEDLNTKFAQEIQKALPEGTIESLRVDTVMGWALLIETMRMAEIWAFITLSLGGTLPEASIMDNYFTKGLVSSAFPTLPVTNNEKKRLFINAIVLWFIGNNQYDACGAKIILALLAASMKERKQLHLWLDAKKKLVSDDDRLKLLCLAYSGASPEVILNILMTGKLPVQN